MGNNNISFIATGDSFITRSAPQNINFKELSELIQQHDVKLTNLETTIRKDEGFPAAQSGGTWAYASPNVLNTLSSYGFNSISLANNHILDYSYEGLAATEKYVNEAGFIYCGAGHNLYEASKPKYLETINGRIALIGVTSTFHESWIAGEQRIDCKGRPGINPLRYDVVHKIHNNKMKILKEIANITEINAEINIAVKNGNLINIIPDDYFPFGEYDFITINNEEEEGSITKCHTTDISRIYKSISEASRQSDYVILNVHSHEMKGESENKPADFLVEFGKGCIDQGAHAIICHGPHIIRGIEIYKNRPILYGLGNFIFQNETIETLPSDFYSSLNLDYSHSTADLLDKKNKNNTTSFGAKRKFWDSFLPSWKMKNGKLQEMTLYPISLEWELPRYKRGWPKLVQNTDILKKVNDLSAPYGVHIDIQSNGIGKLIW
ncbi:capsule biosynthesis protein [Bacillus fungorum]|uniref:Capsule biosynthesis protein n=1 Tax=Bacillus fungorum TaxID=2039284 RepID=A0A2G6QA00_9BACI|nr:CapA family protein [Bacillus fungorum]PIE93571.1 capsule biosynthesis protein [Bacillus fungorum]